MGRLFTIPINTSLPNQKLKITLSGSIYELEIIYNTRMQRWTMNINDAAGNQLLQGVVLLIDRDLTGQYLQLSIPPGLFICSDDTGKGTQPTQSSFNVDHTSWYFAPEDS